MKFFWKVIKNTVATAAPLSDFEKYKRALKNYQSSVNKDDASFLQSIVGTDTPIDDVLFAMNTEFDPEYYLSINQDVSASGMDPSYHYMIWGWKEKRTPSRFFDPHFYWLQNKGLGELTFALAHYAKSKEIGERRGNAISNRLWFEPFLPDTNSWRSLKPAIRSSQTRAVVILPVYKGLEETLTSVYCALKSRGNDRYSLLVVNDKSPDEDLTLELRKLAEMGLFDFHDSNINRGFVKTINYAIEHLTGDLDVVLLNSDAYVNFGWFSRLITHADLDPTVATITPLSNNATICSYPLYDADNFLALEVSPSQLDELASVANHGLAVDTPTGVGFCFYMRRTVINELGALDADAFLVGYGEENDFCMRALNAGYRNLIIGDVFVFHTGSVSFSATKEENFTRGQKNLLAKHPNYDSLVRSHVNVDPEKYLNRYRRPS